MSRFLPFAVLGAAAAVGLLSWTLACSSGDFDSVGTPGDAGAVRRDGGPVDPTEPGPPLDASAGPPPSCDKYCDLVMANCTGEHAQYASAEECLAFCEHLPLDHPSRKADDKQASSVACRQYWADGPARTSPTAYCLAAGPFGGNACGDRCTAFCDVVLSACSPDGGEAAYASQPECATACAQFAYLDAGVDGGGEGPDGPQGGDSLNCRLYWLRAATVDTEHCAALTSESHRCKD